jgi:hypothetical protein
MPDRKLRDQLGQLGAAIETCLDGRHILSALTLLYSAIGTVCWLDSEQQFETRADFKRWAEKYMLNAKGSKAVECTAIELYAARCGILHTSSGESRLAADGEARMLQYAWGTGSAAAANEVGKAIGMAAYKKGLEDGGNR